MKKIFILLFIFAVFSKSFSQVDFLNGSLNFGFLDKSDFKLDIKFVDPDKGNVGLDYKLDLQKTISSINTERNLFKKSINLNFNSKGFLTVQEPKKSNANIISELSIEAFPLLYLKSKPLNVKPVNWEDAVDDPDLEKKTSLYASRVACPLWIFLNANAKNETTQDFENYDFTFGGRLSINTSYLTGILDYLFGLLRNSKKNNPRQLDISLGYDYVTGVNKTKLAPLMDSSKFMNRLNIRGEWETGIFTERDRICFYFDAYNNLNATDKIKEAKKDWTYFYMIRLDHLLYYSVESKTLLKVSIKYTNGKLPPNFEQGYVLGGGFSIDF